MNLFWLLRFIFVALIGAFLVWQPGQVHMTWLNYEVDTSVSFLLVSVVLSFLILLSVFRLAWYWLYRWNLVKIKHQKIELENEIDAFLHLWVARFLKKDISDIKTFRKLRDKYPSLFHLWSLDLALERGEWASVVALATNCLENKQTEVFGLYALAIDAMAQNNLKMAKDYLDKAISLDNDQPLLHEKAFQVESSLKNWGGAKVHLDYLLARGGLDRKDYQDRLAHLNYKQAKNFYEQGKLEEAVTSAERAFEAMAHDEKIYGLLLRLYAKQEDQKAMEKTLSAHLQAGGRFPALQLFFSLRPDLKGAKKDGFIDKLFKKDETSLLRAHAFAEHALEKHDFVKAEGLLRPWLSLDVPPSSVREIGRVIIAEKYGRKSEEYRQWQEKLAASSS